LADPSSVRVVVAVYVAGLNDTVAGLKEAWSSPGTPWADSVTSPVKVVVGVNARFAQVTSTGTCVCEHGATLIGLGIDTVNGGNTS